MSAIDDRETIAAALEASAAGLIVQARAVRGLPVAVAPSPAPVPPALEVFGVPSRDLVVGEALLIGARLKAGSTFGKGVKLKVAFGAASWENPTAKDGNAYAAQDTDGNFFAWTIPDTTDTITFTPSVTDASGKLVTGQSVTARVARPTPAGVVVPSGKVDYKAKFLELGKWKSAGSRVMWVREDNAVGIDAVIAPNFGLVCRNRNQFAKADTDRLEASGALHAMYVDLVECPASSPYRLGSGSGYWGTTIAGDVRQDGFYVNVLKPKVAAAVTEGADLLVLDDGEWGYLLGIGALSDDQWRANAAIIARIKADFPGIGIVLNMDGGSILRALQHPEWNLIGTPNAVVDMPHVEWMLFQVMDQSAIGTGRSKTQLDGLQALALAGYPRAGLEYANVQANAIRAQQEYQKYDAMCAVNTSSGTRGGVAWNRLI